MNIYEFADIVDAQIECVRYPNQDRWAADFRYCEVRTGQSGLLGVSGGGSGPQTAMSDYVRRIRGQRLIFNATSSTARREYVCPDDLEEKT